MILSARKRFEDTPVAKAWVDVAASETFSKAAEASLLIVQDQFSRTPDASTAAANCYRLEGARVFLETLAGLGLAPAEKSKNAGMPANLKHNV